MDVSVNYVGINSLLIKASGRLDLDSAVEYGTKVSDAIYDAPENITELVLDFSEITFISSFGLKVVLELYKKMQENKGTLKMRTVSEEIKKSFKLVGFDKFLVFE